MNFQIKIPLADTEWSDIELTLVERRSGMGDRVQVCLHSKGDQPDQGQSVWIHKRDLIRVAQMLSAGDDLVDINA